MDVAKYIDILEQACSKRELASHLFYKSYEANNESLINQRMYTILKRSKASLQDEFRSKLNKKPLDFGERICATVEYARRESILNYYLAFFEELLKKEEEGESND